MVKRKRRSGVWYHRCPDFKLVYCGPKYSIPKKELKYTSRGKRLKVSVIADEDDITDRRLEEEKSLV